MAEAKLETVRQCFKSCDPSSKGVLPRHQLTHLLRRLGPELTDRQIEALAAGATSSRGGNDVDYEEWLTWLYTYRSASLTTLATPLQFGASSPSASSAATLRVIQVTDVYTLDNFPRLRGVILSKRAELSAIRGNGSKTISMLTGDFLMPYLLSSVDHGRGMMQMINNTPIDYLTWGNHEDDLPHRTLMEREREYKGVWINTNMTSHESYANSTCQTDVATVEVSSADGSNVRRVSMLGVLSADPGLYRPGAFGGATIEDPWQTLATYRDKLEAERRCDLILPLCHLYEAQDERTAREFDFPVLLSGHDHHIVDRTLNGTRILKPGSDAHHAVVLDITWDRAGDCAPRIEAELVRVADWETDPELERMVKESYVALDKLKDTQLTFVPPRFRPLSSVGTRGGKSTLAAYLCSTVRDALNLCCIKGSPHCDCVLINGGQFRGSRDYAESQHITLEALRSELDDAVKIFVVQVPGSILRGALRETWRGVNGGWMHYDDKVQVDDEGFVVQIDRKPLDEGRLYRIGTTTRFGLRCSASVDAYLTRELGHMQDKDAAVPVHSLLIAFFAEQAWKCIYKVLDADKDGEISRKEFRTLDRNNSGMLEADEILSGLHEIVELSIAEGEYSFVEAVMSIAGKRNSCGGITLEDVNSQRFERMRELHNLLETSRSTKRLVQ